MFTSAGAPGRVLTAQFADQINDQLSDKLTCKQINDVSDTMTSQKQNKYQSCCLWRLPVLQTPLADTTVVKELRTSNMAARGCVVTLRPSAEGLAMMASASPGLPSITH